MRTLRWQSLYSVAASAKRPLLMCMRRSRATRAFTVARVAKTGLLRRCTSAAARTLFVRSIWRMEVRYTYGVRSAELLRLEAVPFHPEDQHPRMACPRCTSERSDDSSKDLFAIQGLSPGKYDPTIPEMWMRCPAIKLDDSIAGMDAIRVS
jgi:hypothetical protein